ncbi:hypothetical protein FPQ18DRAFT_354408 [Pyronema domesticum]|uniref:CFEM domain-containing protein n=1 Tax=Pyronema omphalodes (strain CBS 100304) TaxID=1076935 RepID=U4LEN0_PYROM|nr:hypothetical protein FPQ18DRAFT_354408 [Pyronema domesticum]CCX13195.1 Similar to hypothetical protein AOL_s00076g241 [Arthrobotrys oligospora ATCC 24927]; acc. no. EGX50166 [Pyronema omphalodes CBS 100304]
MQFSQVIILASIATLVVASPVPKVSIADIPKCAVKCFLGSTITSGCGTNVSCLCKNSAFVKSVTECVPNSCTRAQIPPILEFANAQCKGVKGFPLTMS